MKYTESIIYILLGGGGFVTLIIGLVNGWWARPKTEAEKNKIQAEADITIAGGWKDLVLDLQKTQKEQKGEIASLNEKMGEYIYSLSQKDRRIYELEQRVKDLENELKKYRNLDVKVDEVREVLHENLDQNLDELKK